MYSYLLLLQPEANHLYNIFLTDAAGSSKFCDLFDMLLNLSQILLTDQFHIAGGYERAFSLDRILNFQ